MKTIQTLKVYEAQGRKVILKGVAGDQFGHVQCIETGETFSTYGYHHLPKVGTVKVETTLTDFKPE